MDFSGLMDAIVSLAQHNVIIVIVLLLVLLFFMYWKPKAFFGILLLVLFLTGLFYMTMNMADSGSGQTRKLIEREEKQWDNSR